MVAFGFRRVEAQFEARLTPVAGRPQGAGAEGKIERKRYTGGAERLKLRCRGIGLPDGSRLTLMIAGQAVADLGVNGGRVRLDIDGAAPGAVPEVRAGDFAELCVDGKAIVQGGFRRD